METPCSSFRAPLEVEASTCLEGALRRRREPLPKMGKLDARLVSTSRQVLQDPSTRVSPEIRPL